MVKHRNANLKITIALVEHWPKQRAKAKSLGSIPSSDIKKMATANKNFLFKNFKAILQTECRMPIYNWHLALLGSLKYSARTKRDAEGILFECSFYNKIIFYCKRN